MTDGTIDRLICQGIDHAILREGKKGQLSDRTDDHTRNGSARWIKLVRPDMPST
jgi:hypothetical protein